jgi:hypothetical protein
MRNQPIHVSRSETTRRRLLYRPALIRSRGSTVVCLLAALMLLVLTHPQPGDAATPIGWRLDLTVTATPPTPTPTPRTSTSTPTPRPTTIPTPPTSTDTPVPSPVGIIQPPRNKRTQRTPTPQPTVVLSPTAELSATAPPTLPTSAASASATPTTRRAQARLPKSSAPPARPLLWPLALGTVALLLAGSLLARCAARRKVIKD